MDLAEAVEFDLELARENIQQVRPEMQILFTIRALL
jgi:Ni2+-binding GTPase involved in maturation of urease and hydrogenase